MRVVLPPANAAFNAAAGTITFSTTIPASLSHVLFVANLTRGVVYFDPTNESGGGYLGTATYASPVLSLQGINTAEHANGDRLFIEWDDGTSGGGGGGGGGGDASAANQTLQLTQLQAINTDLGAPADAAATSDDGSFGLLPLVKRLLGKLPALVSGRIPVDHSAVIQLGSGTVTASTQRVVLANDGPGVSALTSIAGMAIPAHDHLTLSYTAGSLTQVVYRTGGAGGTVVGTLTLGYTSGVLTSVARS